MDQKTAHLLLLLGLFSETLSYFILIQEPKNWTEARSFCKKFHLDLATVQSDQDRSKIKEVAGSTSLSAWMGLYDGVCTWRWSFQDQDVVFKNWEILEDTTSRTQRECGVVTESGTWRTNSCDEKKFYFCYTGKDGSEKFLFIQIRLTWREALHYCRMYYVDLAIIADPTDSTYILYLILPWTGYGYSGIEGWIGLSKNLWLWSDQSSVTWLSLKWINVEPNNNSGNRKCGFVQETGLIGDEDCSHELPFFCTIRRKKQLVRVAVKSSGHLNESAVMAAVEEKISQMLTEQNMLAGSSLTWTVHPDGKMFQQQENHTRNTRTV